VRFSLILQPQLPSQITCLYPYGLYHLVVVGAVADIVAAVVVVTTDDVVVMFGTRHERHDALFLL